MSSSSENESRSSDNDKQIRNVRGKKMAQLLERNKELTSQWLTFRKSHLAIPLRDEDSLTCSSTSFPVCIRIGSISNFTTPKIKLAKGSVVSAQVFVSLFNKATRKFFGNTWTSNEIDSVKLNKRTSLKVSQNVYFFTKVKDSNCIAIMEVVLVVRQGKVAKSSYSESSSTSGRGVELHTCGWTTLSLSKTSKSGASKSVHVCSMYEGSPRALMMFGENTLPEKLRDMGLSASIFQFPSIKPLQGLVRENELFSEDSIIPGLRPVRLPSKVHVKSKARLAPCLGKNSASKLNTKKLPCMVATLSNLHVLVHASLEDAVCEYLERYRGCKVAGDGQFLLKFSPHNGRTGMQLEGGKSRREENLQEADSASWVTVKLKRGISVAKHGEEFQELLARKTVVVPGMVEDPHVALACELQFKILVESNSQKRGGGLFGRSRNIPGSNLRGDHEVSVVIGCGVWIPYNGKVMLLRNQPIRKAKRPIELELHVADQPPFSTGTSYAHVARTIPRSLISFKLAVDAMSEAFRKRKESTRSSEDESSDAGSQKENHRQRSKRRSESTSEDESQDSGSDESDESEEGSIDSEEGSEESLDESGSEESLDYSDEEDVSSSDSEAEKAAAATRKKKPKKKTNKSSPTKVKQVVEFTPSNARDRMSGSRYPSSNGPLAGSLLAASLQLPLNGSGGNSNTDQKVSPGELVVDDHMNLAGNPLPQHSNLHTYPPESKAYSMPPVSLPAPNLPRASRTLLSQHGFKNVMGANPGTRSDPFVGPAPSIEVEVTDRYNVHEITFQFAAYRMVQGENITMPRNVHFTFQFYNALPTRTERMSLLSHKHGEVASRIRFQDGCSRPHILVRADQSTSRKPAPSMALKYMVDTSKNEHDARHFAEYMCFKPLRISVWDSDSLLPLGEVLVDLKPLLRQGDPERKFAGEFDIVQEDVSGGVIDVMNTNTLRGKLIGKLQLIATNFGLKGAEQKPEEPTSVKRGHVLALRDKDVQPFTQNRSKVPTVRHRARPLADTNSELATLLESAGINERTSTRGRKQKRQAALAQSRSSKMRATVDNFSLSPQELEILREKFDEYNSNEIKYDEFLKFVGMDRLSREKRYDQRILNAFLHRVGLKVESMERRTNNTNVLWSTFRDFDPQLSGLVAWDKFTVAVQRLHIPRITSEESRALKRVLVRKNGSTEVGSEAITTNSEGMSPHEPGKEFDWVHFIRCVRANMTGGDGLDIRDVVGRLQMVFLKAEKSGTKPNEVFKHFDANGDGVVTKEELKEGLESIGFKLHSDEELNLLVKDFSDDVNGSISYHDFLHFVQKPQQGVLGEVSLVEETDQGTTDKGRRKQDGKNPKALMKIEKQLGDILRAGQAQGIGIKESFELFDADGSGVVSHGEFKSALETLGFKDFNDDDIKAVIEKYDQRKEGKLSYSAFIEMVEGSSTESGSNKKPRESPSDYRLLESIAQLISEATSQGVDVNDIFGHFDQDGNGQITRKELEQGLSSLGFRLDASDNSQFDNAFAKLDKDKNGKVSVDEFLEFVNRYDKERQSSFEKSVAEILNKAISQGIELKSCFEHFDKNQDGSLSLEEFQEALVEIGFPKSATMASNIETLLERYDLNKNGKIDYEEFTDICGSSSSQVSEQVPSSESEEREKLSPDEEGKSATEDPDGEQDEDLLTLQGCISDSGTSNRDIRQAIRKQASSKGMITERGVKRSLKRIYVSRSRIDECTRIIMNRVSNEREQYEDTLVAVDHVLSLLTSCNRWDRGSEEEGSDSDDESLDKESTRKLKSKVFKVLKQAYFQGLDVERVFSRMDRAQSGVISVQDFEEGLMQTGFSLFPLNGVGHDDAADAMNELTLDPQGKLEQLESSRNNRVVAAKRHSIRHRAAMGRDRLDPDGEFEDKASALDIVRQYREGRKRFVVGSMLQQAVTTKYTITPNFGKAEYFEFQFSNPYNHEERFVIEFQDPELRVILDAREWQHYRTVTHPSCGETYGGVEQDLLSEDLEVTLHANERISVPFVFLSFASGAVDESPQSDDRSRNLSTSLGTASPIRSRTISVTCNSRSHQHTVALLQVSVKPRHFVVDRTFHFWSASNDYFKRCLRVFPSTKLRQLRSRPQEHSGLNFTGETRESSSSMYIYCPEPDVVVEWKEVATRGATGLVNVQEVYLKYRCGEFPSGGCFHLLLYSDPFHCLLEQVWCVSVQTMLRVDVHAILGQNVPKELIVRGDRFSRRVKCFASEPAEVQFCPSSSLQLVAGAYNKVQMNFRPLTLARPRPLAIHMVDCDSNELVCGWVVSTATSAPVVSKTFDVVVSAESGANKKIAYMNPWNRSRTFLLRTSDPSTVKVKEPRLDILGLGKGYIRLWFDKLGRPNDPKTREVLVFINDEQDQNEECLMVRVEYQ